MTSESAHVSYDEIDEPRKVPSLKSHASREREKITGEGGKAEVPGKGGPPTRTNHSLFVRHDRAGLKGRRGCAKKGGGGHGKFVWGSVNDGLNNEEIQLRKGDPNYDSFEEEDVENQVVFDLQEHHAELARRTGISLEGLNGGGHISFSPTSNFLPNDDPSALPKEITLQQFKQRSASIVKDFFVNEDTSELSTDLVALQSPIFHYEFVRRALSLAMERNSRERELVSRLLSDLYGNHVIGSEQIGKAFERLFELMDDFSLDVPEAKKLISQFLARAIADEVLPPSFLCDPYIERLGGEVVEHAKILLSIQHGLVRLNHVWGITPKSSVQELKNETKLILQEFLSSSDIDEACRCIKNLDVPFFHHEVVKRAVVLSLDYREREQAMMSSLLAELYAREIISSVQVEKGFRALFQSIQDLELDSPGASNILQVFLAQAVKDECISQESADKVSES